MKITTSLNGKCFLFHRFEIILDADTAVYKECKDCRSRKLETCYEDIDYIDTDWMGFKGPAWRLPTHKNQPEK